MTLLVLEGGPWVVTDDLTVGGGRPFHAPTTTIAGSADARVTARGARASQHGAVHKVAVKDGPVGRCTHRLSVQLQLLLRVPELEGAGTLVGWGLLPIRQ